MPVLVDPLPLPCRRLLREAVLAHATSEYRHHFPPQLHVGTPGGPLVTVCDDPSWDHGLRTEVAGAVLRAMQDPPWVWVTRAGGLAPEDAEAVWLGPVLTAARERATDPAFVVVTRHGWRDPRSGVGQQWRRIRRR